MMRHLKSSQHSTHSRDTDAKSCILDTLPIVRRKDEEQWGDYRTQSVILEICDSLTDAMQTGKPGRFRTRHGVAATLRQCRFRNA